MGEHRSDHQEDPAGRGHWHHDRCDVEHGRQDQANRSHELEDAEGLDEADAEVLGPFPTTMLGQFLTTNGRFPLWRYASRCRLSELADTSQACLQAASFRFACRVNSVFRLDYSAFPFVCVVKTKLPGSAENRSSPQMTDNSPSRT
jgi:hypothetical protein